MKYKNVITIMLICLITSSNAFSMDNTTKTFGKPNKMKEYRNNRRGGVIKKSNLRLSDNEITKIVLPKLLLEKCCNMSNFNFLVKSGLDIEVSNDYMQSFLVTLILERELDFFEAIIKSREHRTKLKMDHNFLPKLIFDAFYYCKWSEDITDFDENSRLSFFENVFKKYINICEFNVNYKHPGTGATMLMMESFFACKKMVELLLKQEAAWFLADKNGLVALDYAKIAKNWNIKCLNIDIKFISENANRHDINSASNTTAWLSSCEEVINRLEPLALTQKYPYQERITPHNEAEVLHSIFNLQDPNLSQQQNTNNQITTYFNLSTNFTYLSKRK